jgi:hypothetical protein
MPHLQEWMLAVQVKNTACIATTIAVLWTSTAAHIARIGKLELADECL